MTDMGSGIWSKIFSLSENQHEFKYSIDNWADQENFADGAAGTVTNGGFTNRYINTSGVVSKSYL
jgi:hypothetical protein